MAQFDRQPTHAIPSKFRDLPEAVAWAQRAGMGAKRISQATLEWNSGAPCGSFRETNALLLPCGKGQRFEGIQWRLLSEADAPIYVPAAAPAGMTQ